ncbi:T9SS type A sorting domain-containing protein [Flammeovirga agarivorans]|uniref:T9SS type A sorting domain-containing protein n=1 Tax=Flammeovirga agarivorans TaxID=2726742 RepID=A0A7X8XTR7_9BACT|nr:T9SS type A sorting domain-containing protein [Flammeovirga agarivorans]NLR89626.1 T9SS type A sorting domain-containing protein [Flammeovirga agarivorans]
MNKIKLLLVCLFMSHLSYSQWDKIELPNNADVHHLAYDCDGVLWAGTTKSLYHQENGEWVKNDFDFSDDGVDGIICTGDYLFVGTGNDIYRKPMDGDSWTQMGRVFLGGHINGFFLLENGTLVAYTDELIFTTSDFGANWDQLENIGSRETLTGVSFIDNTIYGGTASGLYKYNPDAENEEDKWKIELGVEVVSMINASGNLIVNSTSGTRHSLGFAWSLAQGESDAIVEHIVEKDYKLYGITDEGKFIYSGTTAVNWETPETIGVENINTIFYTDQLVFGTEEGVVKASDEEFLNTGFNDLEINGSFELKGKYYISTDNGYYEYDNNELNYYEDFPMYYLTNSLTVGEYEVLWNEYNVYIQKDGEDTWNEIYKSEGNRSGINSATDFNNKLFVSNGSSIIKTELDEINWLNASTGIGGSDLIVTSTKDKLVSSTSFYINTSDNEGVEWESQYHLYAFYRFEGIHKNSDRNYLQASINAGGYFKYLSDDDSLKALQDSVYSTRSIVLYADEDLVIQNGIGVKVAKTGDELDFVLRNKGLGKLVDGEVEFPKVEQVDKVDDHFVIYTDEGFFVRSEDELLAEVPAIQNVVALRDSADINEDMVIEIEFDSEGTDAIIYDFTLSSITDNDPDCWCNAQMINGNEYTLSNEWLLNVFNIGSFEYLYDEDLDKGLKSLRLLNNDDYDTSVRSDRLTVTYRNSNEGEDGDNEENPTAIDLEQQLLSSYPNPVQDLLSLNFKQKGIYQVSIFDAFGKKVDSFTSAKQSESIDMSSFTPGMYIIKVIDNEQNKFIQKVIKQ